ncbi:MAG: DUF2163 domain-containing protein [Sphingorhabdus sp.]
MDGPLITVAYGWRLERTDGVTVGFTSHDADVLHDGILLQSSPGMQPTTIVQSAGLENDGLDVSGALTSDVIRSDDLTAGRWDGAYLEIFLFDWTAPASGKRILASGELGAVSFADDAFSAELVGIQSRLDRAVAPQTAPSCRAQFCDAACGLNRERFRHLATISSVQDYAVSVSSIALFAVGQLAYGSVRWLTGPNAGLEYSIANNGPTTIELQTMPQAPVNAGDLIEVIEGCDKLMTTCAARFGNGVNFRGEPYLPGNDLLTRYPGAS